MTYDHDARLLRLAALAAEEAEALLALLPAGISVQYDRSPSHGPADETGRRAKGGHSDPTADVALDTPRLHLRAVLTRSEPHLAAAVARIRGTRRALERALREWEGEPDDVD